MKVRPWPIVILAAINVFSPFANLLFSAWLVKMSPIAYMAALWHQEGWQEILSFYLLIPLAGVAIYAVKEWSYPVFISIMGSVLYSNFQYWKQYPGIFSFPMMVATFAFNIGVVTYFLLPSVRAAYFNPRLRWWETEPRYSIGVPGVLAGPWGKRRIQVNNLSVGGAFVDSKKALKPNEIVSLQFSFFGAPYEVSAKVIHRRSDGYGLQFIHTPETLHRVERLTKAMGTLGIEAPSRALAPEDHFSGWFTHLLTTGEGLVPQIPNHGASIRVASKGRKARAAYQDDPSPVLEIRRRKSRVASRVSGRKIKRKAA